MCRTDSRDEFSETSMARQVSFGQLLREQRLAKGFSLRKFAKLADISPTYLSQVEQGNVDPPTTERVTRFAELLEENADEWIALAGRVPDDLPAIIQSQPTKIPELLREVNGLAAEQLQKLTQQARKLKGQGRRRCRVGIASKIQNAVSACEADRSRFCP